jgi:hypothetical protein
MPFVITTDETLVINPEHVMYVKKEDDGSVNVSFVNGEKLRFEGDPARLVWEGVAGEAEIWNWPAE